MAIKNLLSRYRDLVPGRVLDTKADAMSGDTMLSPDAVISIAKQLDGDLDSWKETIGGTESNIEREKLERRFAEITLIKLLHEQVTGETDRSNEISELQEKLFDYYDPVLFYAALAQKMEQIESKKVPSNLEVPQALLLDRLDQICAERTEAIQLEEPTERTLEVVGDWLNDQYGDILDMIDKSDVEAFDAHAIALYMYRAIQTTPYLRDNDWRVEIIAREKNAISVYADDRLVCIPEQRVVGKEKLKQLVIHEVLGHALRSGVAEATGNIEGVSGTATYQRFEESFLIVLEQCLVKKFDPQRGIDAYVAVGLAVTAGMPRDEIARTLLIIKRLEGKTMAEAVIATQGTLGRIFAGMTDVDKGVAHRKDIDYLYGRNQSWRLLNYMVEHDCVDETMRWLMSAKFNPFSKVDRQHVEQYCNMPGILVSFFNEST